MMRFETALRRSSLLLALVATGLVACVEAPTGAPGSVTLVTDASFYTAQATAVVGNAQRYEMEIVVAIANNTDREITLQACEDEGNSPRFAVSMAAIPNDWSAAYENAWACATASTLTLAIGESRVDRIVLNGPRTYDAVTGNPIGDLEGAMRLVYYVDGRTLWSNAFTVTTASAETQ